MRIHFLGICGTFMGSLALLARDLGYLVSGSDENVYPPMSTQLEAAGIEIKQGYLACHLDPAPDLVVVGNVVKRGVEAVEYMLDRRLPYTSAPQFLYERVLRGRHVLAVSGTHGKTTTTTMLAWILQCAGVDTGFLIGGVPLVDDSDARLQSVFGKSSHLGGGAGDESFFVLEADEYDSAFFDKRSKFVHYRPTTLIINNLEYDHADIFADLAAIQTQFHHLVRSVPANGKILIPKDSKAIDETLALGVWTPVCRVGAGGAGDWTVDLGDGDGSAFVIQNPNGERGKVAWRLGGLHNVHNALMAAAAASQAGVSLSEACAALSRFAGIKRRMELIGGGGVRVYDDFAHHPTAISATLDGLRKKVGPQKIWAIVEPRSNTMKLGVYRDKLAASAAAADETIWFAPANMDWSIADAVAGAKNQRVFDNVAAIVDFVAKNAAAGDHVVVMSNGGFEGIHRRLLDALDRSAPQNSGKN